VDEVMEAFVGTFITHYGRNRQKAKKVSVAIFFI
jgi:hypothetical protein